MPALADLNTLLGKPPDVRLDWGDLIAGELSRRVGREAVGAYAALRGDELLYVGRSETLRKRLGAFVSSLVSGENEPHTAAARMRAIGLRPSEVSIAVYFGEPPFRLLLSCISQLKPALNIENPMKAVSTTRNPDGSFEDPLPEHERTRRAVAAVMRGRSLSPATRRSDWGSVRRASGS